MIPNQLGTLKAILAVATMGAASAGFAPALDAPFVANPATTVLPAQIQLTMATLHAAALSKARTARDSTDAPYLFVTILGSSGAQSSTQMPSADKHWSIRLDEAKGSTALQSLTIAPGDSVRVLFTLMEGDQVNVAEESSANVALGKYKATPASINAASFAATLKPLTSKGAHWLGSATLLMTNEGGKTFWRAVDCVSTCAVSNSPVQAKGAELAVASADGLSTILEFNGDAATYHLKVSAKRAQ